VGGTRFADGLLWQGGETQDLSSQIGHPASKLIPTNRFTVLGLWKRVEEVSGLLEGQW